MSIIHWQELRLQLLEKLIPKITEKNIKKKKRTLVVGGKIPAKLIMRQQGQESVELKPLGIHLLWFLPETTKDVCRG